MHSSVVADSPIPTLIESPMQVERCKFLNIEKIKDSDGRVGEGKNTTILTQDQLNNAVADYLKNKINNTLETP